MKKLFLPRTLRFHLSPRLRQLLLLAGIVLALAGFILSAFSISQRHHIDSIQLLRNKEMLMLRLAAKRDPEKKKEYELKQTELSREYVQERQKHSGLFTTSLLLIISGSICLKVRKNLARR